MKPTSHHMKLGSRSTHLLLIVSELAALRLEGEDGPIYVRDLGLLHENVPHLSPFSLPLIPPTTSTATATREGGGGAAPPARRSPISDLRSSPLRRNLRSEAAGGDDRRNSR
ncbi:unnamed protein product [Spirodela intermedia]|uniref:Uncharacterized protein n=2 Tax=Spirodela intermedia TaxID=51605 RepID=A0A7I8JKA1_SPIIN|nr:unnamed protein product [Spirodela intermedia]CAA6670490.1 unnamed protein product [Spirodela intermedia]CAA7407560.1 unnamed protein product [Spirodela intermedia]